MYLIKSILLEIAFAIMRVCAPHMYHDMMNTPLPYVPTGYKPKEK